MNDRIERPVTDRAERPVADGAGWPVADRAGRLMADRAGRPVADRAGRPSRLSGLWMLVTGGLLFAVVYALLQPAYHWWRFVGMSPRGCPNYGGNGNAGPFGDSGLDLILPLFGIAWLLLVIVEQVLPASWRHRNPANYLLRAAGAILLALSFVYWFQFAPAVVCH